jgi:hypothetical protein
MKNQAVQCKMMAADEDPRLRTMLGRRLIEEERARLSEAAPRVRPPGQADDSVEEGARQRGVDILNAIDQSAPSPAPPPAPPLPPLIGIAEPGSVSTVYLHVEQPTCYITMYGISL